MSKFGKSVIYLSIAQLFFLLCGFLINSFLGRLLGPSDYGLYVVITTLLSIITLVLITGIPNAVSKLISENKEHALFIKSQSLNLQIFLSLILTFFYFILAKPIAYILGDPSLVPYIRLTSFVFPVYSIYSIFIGYFNGLQNFLKQAYLSIIYIFSRLFFTILLVLTFGLSGSFLPFIIAPIMGIIFYFKMDGSPEKSSFKTFDNFYLKIAKISLPLIIFSVLFNFLINLDLLFVKFFLTGLDTGLYAASSTLIKMTYTFTLTIAGVLFPSISAFIAFNKYDEAKSLIDYSIRYTLIFIFPLIFYIFLRSKNIVSLVYGNSYNDAWINLSVLSIAFLFFTFSYIFLTLINALGFYNESVWIVIFGLILSFILNIFFVPIFGVIGAAITTSLVGLLVLIISGFYVKKRFDFKIKKKSIFSIISSSILASSIILIFSFVSDSNLIVIPEVILFFITYFVLLIFLFKELTKTDIMKIVGSIPLFTKFRFLFDYLDGKV